MVDGTDRLYRFDYDDRDRLVRRQAPAPSNAAETWTYDEADHVTSHTDAEGYVTTYTYNQAGLVTAVANPDGGTSTYTYTTGGDGVPGNLLATSTDPLGRLWLFWAQSYEVFDGRVGVWMIHCADPAAASPQELALSRL